jgi:hypothetical protein
MLLDHVEEVTTKDRTTRVEGSEVSGAASFGGYLVPFKGRIRGICGRRRYADEGNKHYGRSPVAS